MEKSFRGGRKIDFSSLFCRLKMMHSSKFEKIFGTVWTSFQNHNVKKKRTEGGRATGREKLCCDFFCKLKMMEGLKV